MRESVHRLSQRPVVMPHGSCTPECCFSCCCAFKPSIQPHHVQPPAVFLFKPEEPGSFEPDIRTAAELVSLPEDGRQQRQLFQKIASEQSPHCHPYKTTRAALPRRPG